MGRESRGPLTASCDKALGRAAARLAARLAGRLAERCVARRRSARREIGSRIRSERDDTELLGRVSARVGACRREWRRDGELGSLPTRRVRESATQRQELSLITDLHSYTIRRVSRVVSEERWVARPPLDGLSPSGEPAG